MDYKNVYDVVTATLDKPHADSLRDILNNPKLGGYFVIIDPGTGLTDGAKGFSTLAKYCTGEAPFDVVPGSFAKGVAGLILRMDLEPTLYAKLDDRPQVRGLPEMLRAVADNQEAVGPMLPMFKVAPDELRAEAAEIERLRAMLDLGRNFMRIIYANLVSREQGAAQRVKKQYDLARSFIQAHGMLSPRFVSVEDYFYGASQEGAQTARVNKERVEELTEKAQARADVRATEQAERTVVDRLGTIMKTLTTPTTDLPPPSPTADPRKSSR